MIPARSPRRAPLSERLLVVDPRALAFDDARVGALPRFFRAGDLVVVNDAATYPASLAGTSASGAPVEARLAGRAADGAWRAVLFGAGDWRTRTEDRAPPPAVRPGDTLRLAGLDARVVAVDAAAARLVTLRFDAADDDVWRAIYREGRYVQYAYVDAPIAAWDAQTPYAGEPWASEMPSAGRPLAWELLDALRARGVQVARVTHAAGLSSTGDAALDARLPLPERWRVPAETARAVGEAKRAGARVVAVGTTVTRALEGAARAGGGALVAGEGVTDLRLGPASRLRVVDGILTGLHERAASHFSLLHAFAPRALLARAYDHAERAGYLCHEFGDSCLVAPGALAA